MHNSMCPTSDLLKAKTFPRMKGYNDTVIRLITSIIYRMSSEHHHVEQLPKKHHQ